MSDFKNYARSDDGYKGYEVRGMLCPTVLDPETYMPKRTLRLEVDVPFPGYGGRSMTDGEIALNESDLADKITSELRTKVMEYIKKTDPFGDRRASRG